jgi:hypothetical protein
MKTRMSEGVSVRECMLKMIVVFEEVKVLVAIIDLMSQTDIVLETLLESFTWFKLNYNMAKINMNISELMKELQAVEKIMKPKFTVLL